MGYSDSVVLLASAARTATPTIADQFTEGAARCHVIVDVTAAAGTGVTPKIQGKDAASGKYYDVLVGSVITTTGTSVLKVGPGLTASANAAASDFLPAVWRVVVTHSDSSSLTYSVGAVISE